MTRCRINLSLAPFLLACALAAAAPVAAHDPDPLTRAPFAPSPGAAVEVVTGELKELLVEDRVAGVSVRYRAIVLADGTRLRLSGEALDGVEKGSQVEVTGQRNGRTIFASELRQLAPARTSRSKISVQAAGELQLYYVDYEDPERTTTEFDLRRSDGTVTPLKLDVRPEALQRGMRVTVSGAPLTEGGIEPDSITIEALPAQAPDAQALAVKTDKVLVILMRFTDSPAQPFTQAEVQTVVGGGPGSGSVAEYFKEASYGQQLLTVTVTPWINTGAATPGNCDWRTMGTIGSNAATSAGYNTGNYQKIVYVFPKVNACGWLGLAYVGSSGVWVNGSNTVLVYGHELGHNYGLLHAGNLDCGAAVIGGTCSSSEYADPFSIMGNARAMHMGVAQKASLGWIPASAVKTHTTGATIYTLDPVETAGGTTYAIKVKPTTNRTYWIEYRKPLGFDAALSSYPNNGVQVRLESPFQTLCGGCDAYSQDTQLLDMTPATSSFTDAALLVGNSFTDTTYGITFNVLSTTASNLQIQVVAPGGSTTTTSVTSALNPSTVGASVAFTATVTGTNPTGTVAFKANSTTISGCGTVALVGTGNTRTAVCATAALVAGTHSIVATYAGDGSNPGSSSTTLTQTVNAVTTTTGNVALASNGATASASSTYSSGRIAAKLIDNERKGVAWNSGAGGWQDATVNAWPDWVQIDFAGSRTIDRVVVYSVQDNYTNPVEPTATLAGTLYAARDFLVQGWNGSAWVTLATVTGNTLVKRTVTFTAYTTQRIRIYVTAAAGSYTRLTEVEAWTQGTSPLATTTTLQLATGSNPSAPGTSVTFSASVTGSSPTGTVQFTAGGTTISGCSAAALAGSGNTRTATCTTSALAVGTHAIVAQYSGNATNAPSTSSALTHTVSNANLNVALATNGGVASASSTYSAGRTAAKLIDNERKGAAWNSGYGGWQDATANAWPDWAQINFSGNKAINRVVVYSLQDNYTNPVEPTDTMTGTLYLAKDFLVQGWNGSAWVTLATVVNNTLIKRTITISPYTTSRIRIHVTRAGGSYARLTEVEAWGQ